MYEVLIDTAWGIKVYAFGDKEHCLHSMDLAEMNGFVPELRKVEK
jgi:hypothetical protein